MELRDYLRMLRRGWLMVLVVTVLGIAAASLYLAVTPRTYGTSTTLFVSASSPDSINDLQQGANYSGGAVVTFAQIIGSGVVLGPVGAELRPQRSVDDLFSHVTATVREQTTLIDIGATATDPRTATVIANAVADQAVRILPTLQLNPAGRPLVRVEQIRAATDPIAPSAPNRPRILLIGLVVGLFGGLGLTIVRQSMDTRILRSDDVVQLSDVPLVAVLPAGDRRRRSQGLVSRDDPMSPAGEAFRTLRTNVSAATEHNPRSLVFAAASDAPDAAAVPANLAWSLAQTGRRTLLIDADMRASAVGDLFGIEAGGGLAEILTDPDSTSTTHATTNPMLRVMLSGSASTTPSDLLSSIALGRLLRRFEKEYDLVLLHLPPILDYADAAVVAAAAGGTFVTVAAGRTNAADVTGALDALTHVRVRPLGIVLTGSTRADRPRGPRNAVPARRPLAVDLDGPTLQHQMVARPSPRPAQPSRGLRPNVTPHSPWTSG